MLGSGLFLYMPLQSHIVIGVFLLCLRYEFVSVKGGEYMMHKKNPLHMIAFILLVIGGLNWLIFGIWETELGAWIGGETSMQAKVVYILVGLAALWELIMHKKNCRMCGDGTNASSSSMGGETGMKM